jgi:hypothetical protein
MMHFLTVLFALLGCFILIDLFRSKLPPFLKSVLKLDAEELKEISENPIVKSQQKLEGLDDGIYFQAGEALLFLKNSIEDRALFEELEQLWYLDDTACLVFVFEERLWVVKIKNSYFLPTEWLEQLRNFQAFYLLSEGWTDSWTPGLSRMYPRFTLPTHWAWLRNSYPKLRTLEYDAWEKHLPKSYHPIIHIVTKKPHIAKQVSSLTVANLLGSIPTQNGVYAQEGAWMLVVGGHIVDSAHFQELRQFWYCEITGDEAWIGHRVYIAVFSNRYWVMPVPNTSEYSAASAFFDSHSDQQMREFQLYYAAELKSLPLSWVSLPCGFQQGGQDQQSNIENILSELSVVRPQGPLDYAEWVEILLPIDRRALFSDSLASDSLDIKIQLSKNDSNLPAIPADLKNGIYTHEDLLIFVVNRKIVDTAYPEDLRQFWHLIIYLDDHLEGPTPQTPTYLAVFSERVWMIPVSEKDTVHSTFFQGTWRERMLHFKQYYVGRYLGCPPGWSWKWSGGLSKTSFFNIRPACYRRSSMPMPGWSQISENGSTFDATPLEHLNYKEWCARVEGFD